MNTWFKKHHTWIGILCVIISFIFLGSGMAPAFTNSIGIAFLTAAGFGIFFTTGVLNLVMGKDFYD